MVLTAVRRESCKGQNSRYSTPEPAGDEKRSEGSRKEEEREVVEEDRK